MARLEECQARLLRTLADFDNYRKRAARELAAARAAERDRVVLAWVPVVDFLELALAHADAQPASLAEGVRGVYQAALDALRQCGVQRLDAESGPFDPARHEVAAVVESPPEKGVPAAGQGQAAPGAAPAASVPSAGVTPPAGAPAAGAEAKAPAAGAPGTGAAGGGPAGGAAAPGTVVEVLRPGYAAGDRILRPAAVVVSLGASPAEAAGPNRPESSPGGPGTGPGAAGAGPGGAEAGADAGAGEAAARGGQPRDGQDGRVGEGTAAWRGARKGP